MDTLTALAIGSVNRDKKLMVFDWEKAARLIKERKARHASAGLSGDWDCTGRTIFRDWKPMEKDDTNASLASTWATPEIDIEGETIDCYRFASETPGWDGDTYWPLSALAILDEKS